MILEPVIGSGGGRAVLGWGAGLLGSTPTSRYLYPWYSDQSAEVNEVALIVPRAGTLQGFNVRHNIPSGNGNAITYTVVVNGTPTSISVSLPSTGASGSDLINTVAVAAGDRVSVVATKALGIGKSPRNIVTTADLV